MRQKITVVKSRPVILTAAEVRSVLSGTKTQHRVRIKPQPVQVERYLHGRPTDSTDAASAVMRGPDGKGWACCGPFRCPLGVPGDRLWVREAFIYEPADYEWSWSVSIPVRPATIVYRADCPNPRGAPWKSPVCMPESLSRLTLVIESVRVQRVQDISEEDAGAEGMPSVFERFPGLGHDQRLTSGELMAEQPHRAAYAVAWDERHGSACLWKSNPWVFGLTFKRVEVSR